MSDVSNSVIEKIQKLLKLSENAGATEAEATSAAAKVSELLALHNLSMGEISEKEAVDSIEQNNDRTCNKNDKKWQSWLYKGAADLNFCKYLINVGGSGGIRHMIVGSPINVLAAGLLGDYLVSAVKRICREETKKDYHKFKAATTEKSMAMYKWRFKIGMGIGLLRRCTALAEKRKAKPTITSDGRNLPALQDAYDTANRAINASLSDMNIKNVRGRTTSTYAVMAGKDAALRVNLNQQLGHNAVPAGRLLGSS